MGTLTQTAISKLFIYKRISKEFVGSFADLKSAHKCIKNTISSRSDCQDFDYFELQHEVDYVVFDIEDEVFDLLYDLKSDMPLKNHPLKDFSLFELQNYEPQLKKIVNYFDHYNNDQILALKELIDVLGIEYERSY